MDYCAPTSYIANYATTASSSNNLITKNVDAVNVTADLVATHNLTVDGTSLSTFNDVVDRTKYLSINSSVPSMTYLAGDLTATGELTANKITTQVLSHPTSTGTLSITNPLTLSYTTAGAYTGGTLLGVFCSNTQTNSSLVTALGVASTSYNSWEQAFYYIGNNNVTNRLDFRAAGQSFSPTLSLIHGKVGINKNGPSEALDVTGNIKCSGTVAAGYLSFTNGLTTNKVYVSGNSGTSTIVLSGISTAASRWIIHLYRVGHTANPGVGIRLGNQATGYQATASSATDNMRSDSSQQVFPVTGVALGNAVLLSGSIMITKVTPNASTLLYIASGTTSQVNDGNTEYRTSTIAGQLTAASTTYTWGSLTLFNLYQVGTFYRAESWVSCEWY